ncbi:glycosyltransferase family 39 protein [Roseburia inulinivorans]|nr:glycosyltransferase family 39 protein [Roseburia inulinivorans]
MFCLIGTFVYLSLKELFNEEIAVIATITSVMYMQSEVVQVFYDYVRMVDIFSCAATYFLIKAIKNDDRKKYFILAGIATSLFILTKQNMGLLFWIYSIILICSVSLVLRRSVKEKLIYFITGSIVPIFITIIFMLINGSLIPFFNQTGGEAVAAKGGILHILFNWIINNMSSFINTSKFSIICLACIIVSAIIKKEG